MVPRTNHRPTVRMLGTRGIPAAHGGFETAAEHVAEHLRDHGWRVVVYCQESGTGPLRTEMWNGIERVLVPVTGDGWAATGRFDLRSVKDAVRHRDLCLTFGYNTAALNIAQRVMRIPNVINMDGVEWARSRWGKALRTVLWTNERIACFVGDHLIADHPSIETYLTTRARQSKITTIAYGAPTVTDAPTWPVTDRGLTPGRYLTLICRPILENSILELVQGFSARERGFDLVILGNYDGAGDPYHKAVLEAASSEVRFVGAIYAPEEVNALRFHSAGYLHGHTVGGTNPSLVEALGAGNPVLAHDNEYNRWVAGPEARYFTTAQDADDRITEILADDDLRAAMGRASRERHASEFTWDHVAGQYRALLERFHR